MRFFGEDDQELTLEQFLELAPEELNEDLRKIISAFEEETPENKKKPIE